MSTTRHLFVGLLLAATRALATEIPPGDELRLSIDDIVLMALERNRDLTDARLALVEAEEQVSEAWGEIYPHVDFSASYARNISPAVSFVPANIFDPTAPEGEFLSLQFGADNSWQSSVTVRQPLFDPGAVVGLGAAERFRRLQTEVVRGRTQTVVTRVRQLCYDLQLRFEEVRLIERSLARVRQALEETRSRSGVGLASEYDVLRLEVELANLEPGLLRAANGLASARRQLGVELNLEEPSRLRLTTVDERRPSGSPQSLASQIEALETRALAQRSDVRQLEQMATLRQAQLRREQVEYLPRVSLFGSWDVQAQQNGSPDFFGTKNSRATSKIAGVAVELPLFTGLQRDARIDQRRVVMQQAETQAQLARSRASAEVRDLVAALTEAASREQAQGLAVSQAQRGFDIAMARLREGLGSQLEVTDAEVALRQSEFNLAQATHDRRVTRAHLDLSIGSVPHVDTHVGTDAEETE